MQLTMQTPWQCAVYYRRNPRDNYALSHVEHTTVSKAFPPSLCIKDISQQPSINSQNIHLFKQEPVLILVTGDWADQYTLGRLEILESSDPSRNRVHTHKTQSEQNVVRYDHLKRLRGRLPVNSELTSNYYSMEYHSTMAQYTKTNMHHWQLESVIPFLSDVVVLPKTLHIHTFTTQKARTYVWRPLMRSFQRAISKTFRDSLFIAGHVRYKEDSLEMIRKQQHD